MKAISIGRVLAVVFVAIVVHVGLAGDFRIVGVGSELPLGLTVAGGLAGGVERGTLVGVISGLAVDMFLFTPIGLGALVYGAVGWGVGHLFIDRLEESVLVASVAIAAGTTAGLVGFVAIGSMLGETALLDAPLARILLVASLVNAALAVPLMLAAHWMWRADDTAMR